MSVPTLEMGMRKLSPKLRIVLVSSTMNTTKAAFSKSVSCTCWKEGGRKGGREGRRKEKGGRREGRREGGREKGGRREGRREGGKEKTDTVVCTEGDNVHTADGREEEVATVYVGEGGGRIAMPINTVCLCLCLCSI